MREPGAVRDARTMYTLHHAQRNNSESLKWSIAVAHRGHPRHALRHPSQPRRRHAGAGARPRPRRAAAHDDRCRQRTTFTYPHAQHAGGSPPFCLTHPRTSRRLPLEVDVALGDTKAAAPARLVSAATRRQATCEPCVAHCAHGRLETPRQLHGHARERASEACRMSAAQAPYAGP